MIPTVRSVSDVYLLGSGNTLVRDWRWIRMGISLFWEGLGLEYPIIQVLGTGLDLSHDLLWHLDRVEAVLLYAAG